MKSVNRKIEHTFGIRSISIGGTKVDLCRFIELEKKKDFSLFITVVHKNSSFFSSTPINKHLNR